jgi:plasmid stabilization system protein ParE
VRGSRSSTDVKLVLLAEAETELDHAAAWYDDRREGLGDELLVAVEEALAVIGEAPESWGRWPGAPPRIPPIRRFVLPRFPYSIAYQVHTDFISVLAVAHGRRRPLYWIGRAE